MPQSGANQHERAVPVRKAPYGIRSAANLAIDPFDAVVAPDPPNCCFISASFSCIISPMGTPPDALNFVCNLILYVVGFLFNCAKIFYLIWNLEAYRSALK